MTRSEEDAPTPLQKTASEVDLALSVADADVELLRKGLEEMGISKKTVDRLKKLDGLARSNGHFLSVSLQTTHRSFFVQSIELTEVAAELKRRFLDDIDDPANPGKTIPNNLLSAEERAFYYKCYTEMVKEGRNAYETMVKGTEAMVRMLKAATGKDPEGGAASSGPSWKPTKRDQPKKVK